jgi:FdhD protein
VREEIERITILQFTEQGRIEIEDVVVTELPLTIILNHQEVVTLLCSPTKLEYLTVGYLWSEDLIKSKDEIREIKLDRETGVARVETERAVNVLSKPLLASGGGRECTALSRVRRVSVESPTKLSSSQIFSLMENFVQRSEVFKTTGGVHSAALCEADSLLIFSEDIGRHNAIDKVFGECLLKDIPTDDRLIITSGRVSSEILLKVAKRNIHLLVSKSAPTNLGVRLANDLGITLIGFVRGKRMNIYTHDERVVIDEN